MKKSLVGREAPASRKDPRAAKPIASAEIVRADEMSVASREVRPPEIVHVATPARSKRSFPIVGVGASAGGLDAFVGLLSGIPPAPGAAFVFVQHLDPTHPSHLAEALARASQIPIVEICDGMSVEADHGYVLPAGFSLSIHGGELALSPRPSDGHRPHLPIDAFFSSLASDRGPLALGVVLSGNGADGAEGLSVIEAVGGFTFAQDPASAKFSGMPEAAIKLAAVDFTLPIPALSVEVLRIAEALGGGEIVFGAADLARVLASVRSATGSELDEHEMSRLRRRIVRRMIVRAVPTLSAYAALVEAEPRETRALVEELHLHLMSFARDREVFARLEELLFPDLLRRSAQAGAIRIWCAGCGTGEGAYSVLLSLLDFLERNDATSVPIQLFGTDASEHAIAVARAGLYPLSIARQVGAERLNRHFDLVGTGYRIKKAVRERCTFVKHDLTRDPPFSKLDLVVCSDILLHLGADLRRRALSRFHFGLEQPGVLLLGRAEGISEGSQWFAPFADDERIFARTPSIPAPRPLASHPSTTSDLAKTSEYPPELAEVVQRAKTALLDQYAPPGVIIDDRFDILHFRGRTGPFLEPAPGHPQHGLLEMARKGLRAELRIAIAQARRTKSTVRRANVRVEQSDASGHCDLIVIPVASRIATAGPFYAVLFEERVKGSASAGTGEAELLPASPRDELMVGKLEDELEVAKEYLQSTMVAQERSNEELVAANEELASGNEELQSLNEELETAKEELQSTNEELSTLNEELRTRNAEINSVNDDLINVLANVEVPIVIVDRALKVRRVTPKAAAILNLLPGDVGRPIDDIKPNLSVEKLDRKIGKVIRTASTFEEETQDREGRWYRLQIRPYTTIDKRIDGAVLSVVDIDILKRELGAAALGRDLAKAAVEGVQTPLLLLDDSLVVYSANEAFQETYSVVRENVEGMKLHEVLGGALLGPPLSTSLAGVLEHGERFQRLDVSREVPGLGWRALSLSGRSVVTQGGERLVLLAVEDDTLRMQRETERAHLLDDATAARASAEEANRTKDLFLATLSHELRTPLASMLLQAQMLQMDNLHHDAESVKKAGRAIERATKAQAQLIDDLLDISRIVTGKLKMELAAVRLSAAVRAAVETMTALATKKRIHIDLALDDELPLVACDKARIQQVIVNLLANAIKLTPADGRVTVTVDVSEGKGRIRVADTGIGIDSSFLPRIFDRFSQENRGETRTHGGLGLGLAIVRYLVEAHGGTVQAASEGRGRGATFTILLPLLTESFVVQRPSGTMSQVTQASIKGVDILVVEDDTATREALTQVLSLRGATVRSADSAARAMSVFAERPPQVLLCDISMPEENGHGLLGRIRALDHDHGGDVPAIALTALASEEDRQRSFTAGFQLHMAKPVDTDHLIAALTGLLK